MRIVQVELPEGLFGIGLGHSRFSRLGKVVVLAGRNGSGKTRLLRCVAGLILQGPPEEIRGRAEIEASHMALQASKTKERAERVTQHGVRMNIWRDYEREIELSHRYRSQYNALNSLVLEGSWSSEGACFYTQHQYDLQDPRSCTQGELDQRAQKVYDTGLKNMNESAPHYLTQVLKRGYLAKDTALPMRDDERNHRISLVNELQQALRALLGVEMGMDGNGDPTLFGRPLGDSSLSQGQIVLLQLAVALHAQGGALGSKIILLDEPERHLHPDAMIEVLNRLQKFITDGQIWIATHSVHVLAWAPPDAVWYVDEGRATWAGRAPERVLEGLLGGAQRRAELEQFLQLPAQLAATRFAAQCLLPPEVVTTGPQDEQLKQIRSVVTGRRAEGQPLRVLDYGAGRARLLPALREEVGDDANFSMHIDYRSFDPSEDYAEHRRSVIAESYPQDATQRDFRRMDALHAALDGSIDLVVLCNVLHEVDPGDWITMFADLSRLLAPEGALLLVEDHHIPTGERAHRFGFLILDLPQIQNLFGWKDGDPPIACRVDPRERLKAQVVPASLLRRVTSATRSLALCSLRDRAKEELKRSYGTRSHTYADGERYALWSQLLANAILASDVFAP